MGSYSVTRSVFDSGPAAVSVIWQFPLFFLTLSVLHGLFSKCSMRAPHCSGFVHCRSQALEHMLNSCGAWA